MLKRKVYDELKNWKNTKNKKCLVVQGARQVGKTFAIEQFGEKNYDEVLEINFKEVPSTKEVFAGDLVADQMVMALRFRFPEKRIEPGKTLLFFDEIQECPEAITSLKFWALDNRYDVIASGSLLGIDYKRASSYPVGYVDYIHMHGVDFEEFLWNMGVKPDVVASIREFFEKRMPVPETIHNQMMRYFRIYAAIGGMPEAVWKYVQTKDFREVHKVQRDLLQGYQYDIAHYAEPDEKVKAEKCYLSLSKQLLDKESHKFQYKEIESGARAQKYYSSIEWLLRADIVELCRIVTDVHYDLEDYARDDFFRAYTTDLSLLVAMRDLSFKQQIVENTLVGHTKGGFWESVIADVLLKKGYKLYFYKNETTRKELDFIIQKDGKPIPIEVKSGNTKANSLNSILKKWPEIHESYKLVDGNVGTAENGVITIPLYMAMFL